jgi:hypothetical protein
VLFTFPSRYWFTIGHQQCLALEDGPPYFPQDSTCPVVLKNTSRDFSFSSTGLSPFTVALSRSIRLRKSFITLWQTLESAPCALQPQNSLGSKSTELSRFGLFPVRSPLLRESRLISLPQVTKMFQFTQFPLRYNRSAPILSGQVAPFGNPQLS